MKRILLLLLVVLTTIYGKAQSQPFVIDSHFTPMTMEEMMIAAQAQAYRNKLAEQKFDEYKEKAYQYYNAGDYQGFIYYSDYALSTGWYNNKMYYDRGQVFEIFHEYKKAKKEYKQAMKHGYYPAQSAYEQCKVHQKEWKKSQKR